MHVTPFDPVTADEASALAYADLVADGGEAWTPVGLRQPAAFVLNEARNRPANDRTFLHVASDGARLLGAVEVSWREAPDNRDRAWVHVALRDPETIEPLVRAAATTATSFGRDVLNVEAPRGSAIDAWVRDHGGRLGSVEEHNVTRLRSLDRSDVEALATALPAGYEIVTWDDRTPDDLVDPYVALMRSMNDAPRDDLGMEDWTFSSETLRIWEDGKAARGHHVWNVVARHVATGELAAFNQLQQRPEWPEAISNEDTAVAKPHRGHGLGLCVKAVNLLRAIDTPGAVCVETWNAASNEHMLRVNRRLGFVCEHVWHSWELDAKSL